MSYSKNFNSNGKEIGYSRSNSDGTIDHFDRNGNSTGFTRTYDNGTYDNYDERGRHKGGGYTNSHGTHCTTTDDGYKTYTHDTDTGSYSHDKWWTDTGSSVNTDK